MGSDLGPRLKAARERAHLTQDELAQLLGVKGGRTVRNWEKGKTDPRSHRTNVEDFIAEVNAGRVKAEPLSRYHQWIEDNGELSRDVKDRLHRALDEPREPPPDLPDDSTINPGLTGSP